MFSRDNDHFIKTYWEPDRKRIRRFMALRSMLVLAFIGGGILILVLVQYIVSSMI